MTTRAANWALAHSTAGEASSPTATTSTPDAGVSSRETLVRRLGMPALRNSFCRICSSASVLRPAGLATAARPRACWTTCTCTAFQSSACCTAVQSGSSGVWSPLESASAHATRAASKKSSAFSGCPASDVALATAPRSRPPGSSATCPICVRQPSARRHMSPAVQAPIAAVCVKESGSRPRCCASKKRLNAFHHCTPLSQALMAALYVLRPGSKPLCRASRRSPSARSQRRPFPHALMAAFMVNCSGPAVLRLMVSRAPSA
mmetsp:Transcript_44306/g.136957  ORF Transcript_44306/g.136957 Transcript_44306/m.136957 type:complete len:262 (+) Transcript_44306:538-1323(+)